MGFHRSMFGGGVYIPKPQDFAMTISVSNVKSRAPLESAYLERETADYNGLRWYVTSHRWKDDGFSGRKDQFVLMPDMSDDRHPFIRQQKEEAERKRRERREAFECEIAALVPAELCQCSKCKSACEAYPGWMTPDEAQSAIAAGFGDKLMLDWYEADSLIPEKVYALAAAARGNEGYLAPSMEPMDSFEMFSMMTSPPRFTCTFFKGGKCEIHNSGFKPIMCRSALVCKGASRSKAAVASLWQNDEAKALIAEWKSAQDVETYDDED